MPDYTTREMLEAIEQRKPLRTLFSGFFPITNTHVSEIIEYDFKKGKRSMAPFVAPRVGGKVMKRQGFTTKTITTPKIAPKRPMTIDDISKRGIGENVYSTKSPEERSNALLAKDMTELEEAIQRRKEWMAREIIINGKIDVQDEEEGVDVQIDFGFDNREVLSGTALWNTATANILGDLKRWRLAIIKESGIAPKIVIFASNVIDAFKSNAEVKAQLNLINSTIGKIEPRVVDPALTFYGRLAELDLDIYSYDEWFIDDNGVEQPMLPAGTVVMLPEEVGTWEYGSVTQIDDEDFVTYEAEIVPKIFVDKENNIKSLTLTSRPIPKPDDVDSWYTAVVL